MTDHQTADRRQWLARMHETCAERFVRRHAHTVAIAIAVAVIVLAWMAER